MAYTGLFYVNKRRLKVYLNETATQLQNNKKDP